MHKVFLRGKRKKYLQLTRYGLVHVQAPDEQHMYLMFALAAELNAGVYNENFKRYASFDDWDRKTRHERKLALQNSEKERKQNRRKVFFTTALILVSFIIGWLLSEFHIL